ncbi:hypothetical protein fHeYen801_032 [Yersinia phage fHe-Yen8-01]|nr:hypothetical protein fHeYen801_032 [Yersinia phage fHe-Yen8-01]
MIKYLAIITIFIIVGCGNTPRPQVTVDQAKPHVPESVRIVCDPVPEDPGTTMGSLYKAYSYLLGLYGECAVRDKSKADWIASQGM